jgi:hypothetical protein
MVDKEKLEVYFNFGIFLLAMLFAAISIVSIYLSAGALFGLWLDYKYQPIFQIIFNLAVFIICIYLIRERLIKR